MEKRNKNSAERKANHISPYRYQFSREELAAELGISTETIDHRRRWAQEHYEAWRKVFLYRGPIDLREWQKMIAAYSDYQYQTHEDPHLKILEGGNQ